MSVRSPIRKLNILQVASHSTTRRGGAIQVCLLVQGLRRRGHNVFTLFRRPKHDYAGHAQGDIQHFKEHIGEAEFFPLEISLSNLKRFGAILRSRNVDVIHVHRDDALVFAYVASFLFHNVPIAAQRGTVYRIRTFLLHRAFRSKHIQRVIAVSRAVKDSLIQQGISENKVDVIYGGVDLRTFHPGVDGKEVRQEAAISPDSFVFGNIAALIAKKGLDVFFNACATVAKELPQAVFLIAGTGKIGKYEKLIEELEIKDKVIYLGYRRDVQNVIAATDVVVCSSTKGEGLTGTVREAMVMKKPVISTDVAGNSEFVIPGKTGFLVNPGDADSLAKEMLRIFSHYDNALSLAEKGFEHVTRLADNERRCDAIEQTYLGVVAKGSGVSGTG